MPTKQRSNAPSASSAASSGSLSRRPAAYRSSMTTFLPSRYPNSCSPCLKAASQGLKGSIEPGKLADLVVLEQNLFEVPPLEIHTVNTDMTIFDGQIIYER